MLAISFHDEFHSGSPPEGTSVFVLFCCILVRVARTKKRTREERERERKREREREIKMRRKRRKKTKRGESKWPPVRSNFPFFDSSLPFILLLPPPYFSYHISFFFVFLLRCLLLFSYSHPSSLRADTITICILCTVPNSSHGNPVKLGKNPVKPSKTRSNPVKPSKTK